MKKDERETYNEKVKREEKSHERWKFEKVKKRRMDDWKNSGKSADWRG